MKKIILALVSIIVMGSCAKHDFEPYTYEDQQKEEFENSFEKHFGTPAEDQDWGFDNNEIVDLTSFAQARTRSHNVNRNEWANTFVIPANVTANERDLVLAEFSKLREGATNEYNINLADYFIYEVWKGTDTYHDGFGAELTGSDHMNHLQVKHSEGNLLPPDNDCWEHANDFNNGNHNATWNNIEGATLMLNSGTLDFAYHNSTDSKYHMEYIIIPGEKIDASLAGYWYVGFDFCASHPEGQEANKNMDVERNWVFNDWIVRISPAQFKAARRIIAEDLAADNGTDFDYNDVVFDATLANQWDAKKNSNRLVAHIVLRAAGGTMPLYVAGNEVHGLFGVDTGVMVNTNNGTVNRPVVSFVADIGEADWSGTKTLRDIPIKVIGKNGEITLDTETGQASEKICVETRYVWCDEREPIYTRYTLFPEWVKDRSVSWY